MGETSEAIGSVANFDSLPEDCVEHILSLTTPGAACRLATVSPPFRLAADSDAVWERFLPPDYRTFISRAVDFSPAPAQRKKDLFLSLHHNPLLIDNGAKSFSIDKWTGKKCFMLSARDLHITWGDTPQYWKWTSHPESRFPEVAELRYVWWLEIRSTINASLLSPSTNYAAYLVYKLKTDAESFDHHDTEVSIGQIGGHRSTRIVRLEPAMADQAQQNAHVPGQLRMVMRRPGQRPNKGWWRVELGEFYVNEGDDGVVEMSVLEVKAGTVKTGLIVEGIEIRPKEALMV